MKYIDETNRKEHVYPVYGRQFLAYRWYKPILVVMLFMIFYMILSVALIIGVSVVHGVQTGNPDMSEFFERLQAGYDGMDLYDPVQSVMNLGSLAIMIPALWLASLIVRDRPFSSYSSSRGGWNHRLFWRVFPVAFLCATIPILFIELIIHRRFSDFSMKFTLASFIILTVLGPLQCIAEEYIFRGLLMQTLGSWVRLPVIAVLLQAVLFTAGHPYNRIGQAAILCSGITFALCAWLGRGLEVPAALHICNNMTIFYLQGLNMATITSQSTMADIISDLCIDGAYLIFIFILSKKTNWFDELRKDDLAIANEKYARKMARKAAKRGIAVEGASAYPDLDESVVVFEKTADDEPQGKYEGRHYKN